MFGRRKKPEPSAPEPTSPAPPPQSEPAPGERTKLGRRAKDFLFGTDEHIDEVLEAERRARSAEAIQKKCEKYGWWWPDGS